MLEGQGCVGKSLQSLALHLLRTVRHPGKLCNYLGCWAEELKATRMQNPRTGLSLAAPSVCPTPGTNRTWLEGGPAPSQRSPEQTLTLFLWQGSHLLQEDQEERAQSRGCGGALTEPLCPTTPQLQAGNLWALGTWHLSHTPSRTSTHQALHATSAFQCSSRWIGATGTDSVRNLIHSPVPAWKPNPWATNLGFPTSCASSKTFTTSCCLCSKVRYLHGKHQSQKQVWHALSISENQALVSLFAQQPIFPHASQSLQS